jgi:SAM-dependent methyltransferase
MDLRELPDSSFIRHPWETARCAHFLSQVRAYDPARGAGAILDVGAGDGLIAGELARELPASHVTCWDLGYTSEVVAQLRMQTPELEFVSSRPNASFDLILLLDVLEHVEKDAALLEDLVAGSLRPGGRVIVSVPAWPGLFGAHDVALGHHRRYRPAEGRSLVVGAGLEILACGGLFHGLLPVRWLARRLEPEERSSQPAEASPLVWNRGERLAGLVERALRLETSLSRLLARRQIEIPGLSWWAVCEKSH